MERIAADVEAFHLGLGDLETFLVDPWVECALNFEPGLGRCRRYELDDGSVVCERPAAPVLRDAAEQAVLDLVPFRRAWRIMPADAQRAPELLRRFRKQPKPVVVLQQGAPVLAQLAPAAQSTRVNELG